MVDKDNNNEEVKEQQHEQEAQTQEENSDPKDQQIEELKAQNQELQTRYARLAADFENYKKRTDRQHKDLVARANQNLMCCLLPILDNFYLALGSIEDSKVAKGIELIAGQLATSLESEGLKQIDALGAEFDPNLHEAVAFTESGDHGDNIIVEEVRKGYTLGDKVLRPSMVKVNIKKEDS